MPKDHMKRLASPKTWKIKKKGIRFVTRAHPGAHTLDAGIPLNVLLRDILGYAKTTKEVKNILSNKEVLVDGKRRKDHKFLVGLMDSVSLPEIKQNFRILFDRKGKLAAIPIKDEEAKTKLCKIKGKSFVRKKIQINLHDSRNILLDKDDYKMGDSLMIEVTSQKIKEHLKLEPKSIIYLGGGRHVGEMGTIEDIKGNNITYKTPEGEVYQTLKKYAFVVGKTKPLITLPTS